MDSWQLELIAREAELIPFCPEVYGGRRLRGSRLSAPGTASYQGADGT